MPTGNPDYWVELRQAERTLGAGFLVAHRRVLTAAHCVRGLSPNADLTIAPTVGNLVPARLEEIAERADLALIELLKDPYPHIPHPRTSRCRPRDDWFGPYRPSESDPHLSGSVVHDSVDYECVGGAVIRASSSGALAMKILLGRSPGYAGSACRVFVAGWCTDLVQVLQGLSVGGDEAGLLVGDTDLDAVCLHDRLSLAQVRGRHGGEQVVLDLVVQAAQRRVGQPTAADVAGGQHLLAQKVLVAGRVRHALVVRCERHAEIDAEQRLM
jgi:hypothetical protein